MVLTRPRCRNTALLSFGEVEATDDTLKGPKSLHDLVPEMAAPAAPVPEVAAPLAAFSSKGKGKASDSPEAAPAKASSKKNADSTSDLAGLRARESSKQTAAQAAESERIAALEASIRGFDRPSSSAAAAEKAKAKEKEKKKAKSALAEMRDAYAAKAGGGKADKGKTKEKDTVQLLEKFREGLRSEPLEAGKSKGKEREKSAAKEELLEVDEEEKAMREYGASDSDDDTDWRSHR